MATNDGGLALRRPPFKSMGRCVLIKGHDDKGIRLDIVPTMRSITHGGERFHRMDNAHQIHADGVHAALYLWEGYGRAELAKFETAQRSEEPTP